MICPEAEAMLERELQSAATSGLIIYRQLAAKAKTESVKMKSITKSMKKENVILPDKWFSQPCQFCRTALPCMYAWILWQRSSEMSSKMFSLV